MSVPRPEGVAARVDGLDTGLFSVIDSQTSDRDRRTLLAIHSSIAQRAGALRYLEIGSYLGGSLQAVICDPRCTQVLSIDPRPPAVPDNRGGTWTYEGNSAEGMYTRLNQIPGADLSKLTTFDSDAQSVDAAVITTPPNFCFVDGEHTDAAVVSDAEFCLSVMADDGVLAFHDAGLVRSGIECVLRSHWRQIRGAIRFDGSILAIELGDHGYLDAPVVGQAIESDWHRAVWQRVAKRCPSASSLIALWAAVDALDRWAARRRGLSPAG